MSSYTSSLNTTDVSLTNINQIDSLLYGIKWGGLIGSGMNLSYSFPWTTNQTAYWQNSYSLDNEPYATYHYGLSSNQITAASNALQSWANVANLNFVQIAESGTEVGDFRFAFSSAVTPDAWGWAQYPNDYWAGSADVWINSDESSSDFSIGAYSYEALIHEIGHGLGLKHPGNYNGDSVGGEQGPFLPADLDNRLYTIMSYNDPNVDIWIDTQTLSGSSVNPETPMVLDIAAIQYLYGANNSYHTGDDIYSFDDRAPFIMTLWDAGGHDTISEESSTRSCLIDLNPGHYSNIQTNRIVDINEIIANNNILNVDGTDYSYTLSNPTNSASYNLGIAYGVIIEDAIGGSANDTLIGNNADNLLNGNAGDDQLSGGDGNNTLIGGTGTDTAVYTNNRNSVDIQDNENGTYTIIHGTCYDILNGIEQVSFDDGSMSIGYAIEVRSHQEEFTRFYSALFGRDPDEAGLAYWVNDLVSPTLGGGGNTIQGAAQAFTESAEFQTMYGANVSNDQFVNLLYQNILHRAADQAGFDYWSNEINQSGNRGGMIVSFANSTEYEAATAPTVDTFLSNVALTNYILA